MKAFKGFEEAFSGIVCPYCHKKGVSIFQRTATIPFFGEVFETVTRCDDCGFKHSSVMSLEERDPVRITFVVGKKEDLETRIVKSQSCSVRLLELGITIESKSLSEGYVSNVEGLLLDVERVLGMAGRGGASKKKIAELVEKVERIRAGKEKLTVVFEDKSGVSAIVSKRARVEKLK